MNDFLHRTDILIPFRAVIGSKQIRHWIEFQLVDEQGEPVSGCPVKKSGSNDRQLIISAGECFAYGSVPQGYKLEELGVNEVPLELEVDRTYVFRITGASRSNDAFKVVFCVCRGVNGDFEFKEYTRLPNGVEVVPSCGLKKRNFQSR